MLSESGEQQGNPLRSTSRWESGGGTAQPWPVGAGVSLSARKVSSVPVYHGEADTPQRAGHIQPDTTRLRALPSCLGHGGRGTTDQPRDHGPGAAAGKRGTGRGREATGRSPDPSVRSEGATGTSEQGHHGGDPKGCRLGRAIGSGILSWATRRPRAPSLLPVPLLSPGPACLFSTWPRPQASSFKPDFDFLIKKNFF